MDYTKIINNAISIYEDIKKMGEIVMDFLKDEDIENAYFYIKKRQNLIEEAIEIDKQIVNMYNEKDKKIFEDYANIVRSIMHEIVKKDEEISELLNDMKENTEEKIKEIQKGKEMINAYTLKRVTNRFVDRRG